MNNFEVMLYFICFALIAGAAFAMMWANIQSINIEMRNSNNDRLERQRKYIESFHDHPEAPQAGEEVMYVDLTREKLEDLYHEH